MASRSRVCLLLTAWLIQVCHIVRFGTSGGLRLSSKSEIAIHAGSGEGGGTRIPRKRIVMKTLIASIFALTLLGAGAADAAVVGVHVGGIGVGVGVGHGHHYRHHYVRRHR